MPHERRRVWIVDDSPLDVDRARRALAPAYDVELFEDGSTVLERLTSPDRVPDVLVLDWLMPGVTGLEVCRFIRAAGPPLSLVPVLFITVHQRTQQLVEGLAAGANDYVSKPFDEAELRARVDALVRSQVLRERAELAEATVRHLLANSPDPLLAIDASGVVRFANDESARVFGRSPEGARIAEVLPLAESWLADEDWQSWSDTPLHGRIYAPSMRRAARDGEDLWVLTLRDVTFEREREMRRLDFYSVVAHDLRSPLSAALMRTELLLEGGYGVLPPTAHEHLQKLQRNLGDLIGMINDFLDLARHESSGGVLRSERVDMAALISEILDEYQPVAHAQMLSLRTGKLEPELVVVGDRRRLKQVLSNLVANALKFTPAGGRVRVELERRDASACVSVSDTGRGIAPSALPRLFDRYSRAIDREHEVVGSGLGLMIVKQTVEAHGGDIGVRSREGEGSTFWFRLPLAAGAASHHAA